MHRVLILTVGGSQDPLVNAIREFRRKGPAGFVYLLCSGGPNGSVSMVEGGQDSLVGKTGLSSGDYKVFEVADPDDLDQVFACCERIAGDIATTFGNPGAPSEPAASGALAADDLRCEVVANYTGGTKTMSAGLVAFALEHGGWELNLNTGPRADLVRVYSGDVPVPLRTERLRANKARQLARKLKERLDFEGAAEVLTDLLKEVGLGPEDRQAVLRERTENLLLAAWDRFDYASALEYARSCTDLKEEYDAGLRTLQRGLQIFDEAVDCQDQASRTGAANPQAREPGLRLVEDVLDNAARCARRGRYDDAVARLYRATELLAQVCLWWRYGIRTDSVDPDSDLVPDSARQWLRCKRGKDGKVKIGLDDAYRLLADLKDPVGEQYVGNRTRLRRLLEVRNHSLFAHGLKPIAGDWWTSEGVSWMKWIRDSLNLACK